MHKSASVPNKSADLIGSREAALLLGINRSTFTRWVKAGRLTPAHSLNGRTGALVFFRSDVERLANTTEQVAS